MSQTGRLTASRMMARVRTPPAGMPAAPTLDAVAVTLGGEGRSGRGLLVGEAGAQPVFILSVRWVGGPSLSPPRTHRMVMIFTKSRDRWFSCAMNTAATHWKSAAPSMLTVAPMGRMKRLMCLKTPFFSSTHFIISGKVAELRDRRSELAHTDNLAPGPPNPPNHAHRPAHRALQPSSLPAI